MSAADFERLVGFWRARDVKGALSLFAPDGVFWEAGKEPLRGREAIAGFWEPFFASGIEWKMDIDEVVADAGGERFAIGYTWSMKGSSGEWKSSPGCALVHTANGTIAQWREYKA